MKQYKFRKFSEERGYFKGAAMKSKTDVYFDQCLGAAHSKCLSASAFSLFFWQKAEKRKRKHPKAGRSKFFTFL